MADKGKRLTVLGERLHSLRGSMSQAEFAKKIGVTAATIGYYENSERLPDAEMILKICTACDVSADYLLGRTGDEKGNADVKAVEKRLSLTPKAQRVLEHYTEKMSNPSIKQFYSKTLNVINVIIEDSLCLTNDPEIDNKSVYPPVLDLLTSFFNFDSDKQYELHDDGTIDEYKPYVGKDGEIYHKPNSVRLTKSVMENAFLNELSHSLIERKKRYYSDNKNEV